VTKHLVKETNNTVTNWSSVQQSSTLSLIRS